jgi:SAM-dependent methyltransferase
MGSFDAVVDAYDSGRPAYPDALFHALEPLAGMTVLEGGAGTGIATVGLVQRGAHVVPFDIGVDMLRRALQKMPGVPGVLADGAAMPFRDGCADLLCFAQSWHWLDRERRASEAARVLRPGGRWAAWWSHARADDEPWFVSYWEAIEAATVARREERDTDWGAELRGSPLFDVEDRRTFRWVRETSVEQWLTDDESKTYIASLPEPDRMALLRTIRQEITTSFPTGRMRVPYETWLWVATRR